MRKLLRPLFCAALLASPTAMAGVSGNVGAVTTYLFRGVEQSLTSDPAVQGGLDWSHGSGVYAGTWVSNTEFGGYSGELVSYETDVYGGFTKKWGLFGIDVGALLYYYTDESRLNTLEGYAGVLIGPAAVKVYYTPAYFGATDDGTADGDDLEGMYVTASAVLPLTDTLTVTPQVGFSSGDGVKMFLGDEYTDYSVTLGKTLDNGFSFSLAVVGTDLDSTVVPGDREKIVLGLKKNFDL